MKQALFAAAIFVLVYNLLFFKVSLGIGTGILFLVLNLVFFFIRHKDLKNLNFAILCSVISVIFAFFNGFRANEVVQTINFLTALFFASASLYIFKLNYNFSFKISEYILAPLQLGISNLRTFLNFLKIDTTRLDIKNQTTSSIIRGIAFTIPILFILFVLFSQADPIFNKYAVDIFDTIWERLIISALIFISLFITLISKISDRSAIVEEKIINFSHKIYELIIIAGSVSLLFVAFLVVQFRYLFSQVSESNLSSIGIQSLTYSEYTNKGFFELLIASIVASGVIIYCLKFLHTLSGNRKLILQIFSTLLIVETGLLILSDFRRLDLYQAAHGLTRAREFGFLFLVWLTSILLFLLVTSLVKLKPKQFFYPSFLITLTTLISVNVFNLDGLIAEKYRPTVNNEIDYLYLTSISADAYPAWQDAISGAEKLIIEIESTRNFREDNYRKLTYSRDSLQNIQNKIFYLRETDEWQAFNYSNQQAFSFVKENSDLFNSIPNLLERISILEFNSPQEIRLDRDLNPPLDQ